MLVPIDPGHAAPPSALGQRLGSVLQPPTSPRRRAPSPTVGTTPDRNEPPTPRTSHLTFGRRPISTAVPSDRTYRPLPPCRQPDTGWRLGGSAHFGSWKRRAEGFPTTAPCVEAYVLYEQRQRTKDSRSPCAVSRAALERSDFAVRRLPLIFALK